MSDGTYFRFVGPDGAVEILGSSSSASRGDPPWAPSIWTIGSRGRRAPTSQPPPAQGEDPGALQLHHHRWLQHRTFLRITDNSIELRIRFVTPEHGIRQVKDRMSLDILQGLRVARSRSRQLLLRSWLPNVQISRIPTDAGPDQPSSGAPNPHPLPWLTRFREYRNKAASQSLRNESIPEEVRGTASAAIFSQQPGVTHWRSLGGDSPTVDGVCL